MEGSKQQTVEYKFLRQNRPHAIPKMRFSASVYLAVFHISIIVLFGFFSVYQADNKTDATQRLYSMFMDVHSMMFIGFGFLVTFLKRYGYGGIGFNFLIAAYALEWSLLVKGWFDSGLVEGNGLFTLSLKRLLTADYCTLAVLISFGAVVGKASLSQLIIMTTIEVVLQNVNEFIADNHLFAYDVGKSMYVHVFGALFGLAVSKVLQGKKEVQSGKDNSHYHSDLFAMIGTLFLWLYWPSYNSALAKDEGQIRAIVNTYLSIISSCIATFITSIFVGKGRLSMSHVHSATLAGGIAVGAVADMVIQPWGAMVIGTATGIISVLGFQFITPLLNTGAHDTRGVNNLHGIPGIISGVISAIVAASASRRNFNGNRLYAFYPSRTPVVNSTLYTEFSLAETEFSAGGLGRSAVQQGGYQIAALATTIGFALVGGVIAGYIMKIPIVEQIDQDEEILDDEANWKTPEDYSLKLTEVRVGNEEELQEKRVLTSSS